MSKNVKSHSALTFNHVVGAATLKSILTSVTKTTEIYSSLFLFFVASLELLLIVLVFVLIFICRTKKPVHTLPIVEFSDVSGVARWRSKIQELLVW